MKYVLESCELLGQLTLEPAANKPRNSNYGRQEIYYLCCWLNLCFLKKLEISRLPTKLNYAHVTNTSKVSLNFTSLR